MPRRKLVITVRGREKTWGIPFEGDIRHLEEWRADGLEVDEVLNVIPEWVVYAGLTKPWCFMQDVIFGGILRRR